MTYADKFTKCSLHVEKITSAISEPMPISLPLKTHKTAQDISAYTKWSLITCFSRESVRSWVITRHGLQWADDIQVYICTTVDDAVSAVDRFNTCLTEIETQLRHRSCGNSTSDLTSPMRTFCHCFSKSRTQPQTSTLSQTASCHCQLIDCQTATTSCGKWDRLSGRCLQMPVRHKSTHSSPALVQFFIWHLRPTDERRLQSFQNSATHLVTGTWHCDHIMPVLHLLHWLPI